MNNDLFQTKGGKPTNTTNAAGGKAYKRSDKHELAQYVMTGIFQNTFYASAKEQLDVVIDLASKVDDLFLAKLAVQARQKGFMKDSPVVLLAILSTRDIKLAESIFDKVVDNGKMLRNYVQVMRSGVTGRTSLGSGPKRLVKDWLAKKPAEFIFKNSIGNDPSMADVIKMVHPRPSSDEQKNLYAYLIGKPYNLKQLPDVVQQFEAFKRNPSEVEVPKISFQFLSSYLTDDQWADIAKNCSWTQARMNLNTFERHGVFNKSGMKEVVADKLKDKNLIKRAKVFPYQIMSAYLATENSNIPSSVTNALQDALDVSVENIPTFDGDVVVCNDVSGSMSGNWGRRSTVTPTQIAGLFSSAILNKNEDATLVSFDTSARIQKLNARDSVMTNAKKLAQHGGGTDCGAAIRLLNEKGIKADCIVMVSDNESWVQYKKASWRGTSIDGEWRKFKKNNPKAKLVLIDIDAGRTTQLADSKDVLNVGGFSDQVFNVVNAFMKGDGHWVKQIEDTEI